MTGGKQCLSDTADLHPCKGAPSRVVSGPLLPPACHVRLFAFVFAVFDAASNSPPRAHAGGHRVRVLPSNDITLDGSRSTDDQGVVSYLWVRDGQSPAAGVSA